MRHKFLTSLKYFALLGAVYAPMGMAVTNDMSGTWNSVTLSGSFDKLSNDLKNFRWLVMNQARTRGDTSDGQRFSENLLFVQLGYAINHNASVWLGYTHDWVHSLDELAYQESRPYQDFLWNSNWDKLLFMARTRLEERIHQETGDTGVRLRQLFQLSYPLEFIDNKLSVYAGEEMMGYVNSNSFGRTGFSENRALGGFSYQFTHDLGADLGYLGQYVYNDTGNNVFIHNVQFNLRYQF